MNLGRRDVLRMLGAVGAGTLLPSTVGRTVARAGSPVVPKRIVFFYTEQGTYKPLWAPTAPGAPDATTITSPWSTRDHSLGSLHGPLQGLKDKLTFLDGLDMRSTQASQPGANGHQNGETHALIAQSRIGDALGGGISIDQYIAKAINAGSPLTSLPSLELFVNDSTHDAGAEAHPFYAAPGEPIPLSGAPFTAYDRMFPDGPRGTTPQDIADAARRVAERQAVLEYGRRTFADVGGTLGRLDRDRLAAHAAAMSDLSSRMALVARSTCREPDRTIAAGTGWRQYEANADVMMHLGQTALACDLTRVLSLYVSVPPNEVFGFRPVAGQTDFHGMIHDIHAPALAGNPQALEIMVRYQNYLSIQYAKFLRMLDQIPEADGGTLLDHTLVVWCGQLAAGDHSTDRLPYVLGGRIGGGVTPGRYVRYPRTPEGGLGHNDLLVSLANLMDVPITTFGNPDYCKGPLAGLT